MDNPKTITRTASKQTLKKFGLSQEEWQAMYYRYDGCCHVCKTSLDGKLACVDHEHIKGWKKMKPEDRKRFCRGILCYQCNRLLLQKSVTIEKLKLATKYLESYSIRQAL